MIAKAREIDSLLILLVGANSFADHVDHGLAFGGHRRRATFRNPHSLTLGDDERVPDQLIVTLNETWAGNAVELSRDAGTAPYFLARS